MLLLLLALLPCAASLNIDGQLSSLSCCWRVSCTCRCFALQALFFANNNAATRAAGGNSSSREGHKGGEYSESLPPAKKFPPFLLTHASTFNVALECVCGGGVQQWLVDCVCGKHALLPEEYVVHISIVGLLLLLPASILPAEH